MFGLTLWYFYNIILVLLMTKAIEKGNIWMMISFLFLELALFCFLFGFYAYIILQKT